MWWGKVGVKNWEKSSNFMGRAGDLTPPGARYGCSLKICDKAKGLPVGGGVPDAPDGYENYRTFAIYCAVGRPALWPPESWNIAYILGSAQGTTLQSAARTARKQRRSPLSLRDISPPRGESPSREANAYLRIDTKITKTSLTKSRNGHCARRRVSEANRDFNPGS